MKTFRTILAAAVLAALLAPLSAQTVAVLGFESDSFCLGDSAGMMSDLLSDELVRIEGITVVERKRIDRVIEEMDFQMSGWTDAKTVKAAGKMVNADCVITGSVDTLGATLYVTARMIEVESAKVLHSAKMTCATWDEFSRKLPQFARECVKKMPSPNRFLGTWEGEMPGGSVYEITFAEKGVCTVKASSDGDFGTASGAKGTYSYDKNFLRINARLSSSRISWRSVYKFDGAFGSFNILVPKADDSEETVRVSFIKTAD
ncbi:MAG: CsgG/HfaB family protein [Treponemataceae bacterium]|nr:CsgG/HfaB family protein [Treponemataceae bacterium]